MFPTQLASSIHGVEVRSCTVLPGRDQLFAPIERQCCSLIARLSLNALRTGSRCGLNDQGCVVNSIIGSGLHKLVCVLALLGCSAIGAQAPTISQLVPVAAGRVDMVMPASGLPLVVFQEFGNVKAFQCSNALCTGTPTSVTTIASLTASRIRAALGSDGLPIIGLSTASSGLRAIKCSNAACTSSVTTIIDASNLGSTTDHALIVPADGHPIFAYYDSINHDLKVARCASADCTGVASIVVADATGIVGRHPGLAILGGRPAIVYQSASGMSLLRCGTMDCSVGNSIGTVAAVSVAALSVLEGRDGAALIAFLEDSATQDSLRIIKCTGADCLASSVSIVDSVTTGTGLGNGIQLRHGADGLPVMSYFDMTFGTVKVARCTRPDCANVTTTTLHAPLSKIHTSGGISEMTALAINANGVPVVAYSGQGGRMIVHSCNTRSCQ
jgi:hypothetical protein